MDEIDRLRDRVEKLEIRLATLLARLEAEDADAGKMSRSRQLVLNTCLTALGVIVSAVGLYMRSRG